jgi:hypothetical protein
MYAVTTRKNSFDSRRYCSAIEFPGTAVKFLQKLHIQKCFWKRMLTKSQT